MKKRNVVMSIITAGIVLAGCGGGSSSSTSSPSTATTKSVSGIVYDPAVIGADVFMKCGTNAFKYYAEKKTDKKGFFKIDKLPEALELKTCVVETIGGKDGGEDFKNISFKAPLNMFDLSIKNNIVVSPFSTMVTSYDNVKTDVKGAMKKTSEVLGISEKQLKEIPKEESLKLSKKLVKIALTKDKEGQILGFKALDVDKSGKFTNEFLKDNSNVTSDVKKRITNNFEEIDKTKGTEDEILKLSVKQSVERLLNEVYKLETSNENYEKNIKTFAQKIAESLKLEDGSYKFPTRYIIRKALSDASLQVVYEDGKLTTQLENELTLDNDVFKAKLSKVTLDIKNIQGVKLYDVNSYEKIVGNSNDKRIEYYTFSNISHIGEAIEIAKSSYDDKVLDPIYQKVANGYIKLGFYDEAVDVANENIYSDSIRIETLVQLSSKLIDSKKNDLAKKSLDLAFTSFKIYANAIGEANLKDKDYNLLISMLVNYNNLSLKSQREILVNYINTTIKNAKPVVFNSLSYSIKELIEKAILAQKKEDVKYLVDLGYKFAIQVPLEKQDGTFNYVYRTLMYIVKYTAYVNEIKKGDELLTRAKSAGTSEDVAKFEKDYKGEILAYEILKSKDKMNEVIKNLDSYLGTSYTTVSKILSNGLATALVLDGQTSKAVELITKYYYGGHDPVKSYAQVFKFFINDARIETSNILGFIDKTKQEEFILAMFNDSKNNFSTNKDKILKPAWTFIRSGSKYKDKNKDMIVALFQGYDGVVGYPTMIKYLAKNGSYDKIKDIITFAIDDVVDTKIETFIYKTKGVISILEALEEIKYFDNVSEETLKQNLNTKVKNLASKIKFDNTASSYDVDVDWAIIISKYLANNGELVEAQNILAKIKDSLKNPDTSKLDNVDKYLKRQIGSLNVLNGMDTANQRLLGAYIVTKQLDKAEKLIDDIKVLLDTQEKSLDKDEPLLLLARAYGMINKKEKALAVIKEIQTIKTKNNARLYTTQYISDFDSFPSTNVASIDTDQDGKPDFFNKFATKEQIAKSKLILDDNIDGDDKTDDVDKLPYHKN